MTRRDALRTAGAAAAGALLAPAVRAGLAPGVAWAAGDDPAVLYQLIAREQAAAFAYRRLAAAGHADPARGLARQDRAHAHALATELEGFALDGPRAPHSVARLDAKSARVATAGRSATAAALRAAIALEEDLVATYLDALTKLAVPPVIMTVGTVLGSHAQHLVLLRARAGADPLAATPA